MAHDIMSTPSGVYDHGIGEDGDMLEDLQIFGQEHQDKRVRAIWAAWMRSRRLLQKHADDMATIRRILGVND